MILHLTFKEIKMLRKKQPKINNKIKLLTWKQAKKTNYYDKDKIIETVCGLLKEEWDVFYLNGGIIVGQDLDNINIHSEEDYDIEFIISGIKIIETFPKEVFKILK